MPISRKIDVPRPASYGKEVTDRATPRGRIGFGPLYYCFSKVPPSAAGFNPRHLKSVILSPQRRTTRRVEALVRAKSWIKGGGRKKKPM